MMIETAVVKSPVGKLHLAAHERALLLLAFEESRDEEQKKLEGRLHGARFVEGKDLAGAVDLLKAYFAGEIPALDRIAVDPQGTDWQKRVWKGLREIPAGETLSYGALAKRVGRPGAARAVGAANRTNPIAIVVPCHRVIAADDTLCGYGGGLDRKKWLLEHEAKYTGLFASRPAAQLR